VVVFAELLSLRSYEVGRFGTLPCVSEALASVLAPVLPLVLLGRLWQ
jgi:hypothetical protein